jgi:azurin
VTDFTKTISESINVFGAEPTNKWGTVLWGQKWGYGNTEIVHRIYQSLDDAAIANIIVLSDSTSIRFFKVIGETLRVSDTLDEISLKDSQGYNYIFTTPTENSEDAPSTSWTPSSDPTTTYVTVGDPSTSWSAA